MKDEKKEYLKIKECDLTFVLDNRIREWDDSIAPERFQRIGRIMYLMPVFKSVLDEELANLKIPKPNDLLGKLNDIYTCIRVDNNNGIEHAFEFKLTYQFAKGYEIPDIDYPFGKRIHEGVEASVSFKDLRMTNYKEKIEESKSKLKESIEELIAKMRKMEN